MKFQAHKCRACGEQFIVACLSQLQEKLKKHKCPQQVGGRNNKKMERSKQLEQERIALFVHDIVTNRIEQYNFNKLVKQGVIANV